MSDELINKKWEICVNNMFKKTALSFATGVLLSVFFFRKRAGVVWFSTGVGMGIAYNQCQLEFAHPNIFITNVQRKKLEPSTTTSSSTSSSSSSSLASNSPSPSTVVHNSSSNNGDDSQQNDAEQHS